MLHCITARPAGHPTQSPGMTYSATPARYASPGLPVPCTPIPAPPLVRLYASLLLAGLAGCATLPEAPPAYAGPPPVCVTEHECAVRWTLARQFLLAHATSASFRDDSADYLLTMSHPESYNEDVIGNVRRTTVDGSSYKLVAEFNRCHWAWRYCEPMPELVREFNVAVGDVVVK
jgi:hypothetical protein